MKQSLQRILALAAKELLAVLKDKRSRIVLIVPPLLQLVVFGYAATFDLNDVPVAVYNQDRGAPSRELIARIESYDPDLRMPPPSCAGTSTAATTAPRIAATSASSLTTTASSTIGRALISIAIVG
mgnify:CR=1 FL=1